MLTTAFALLPASVPAMSRIPYGDAGTLGLVLGMSLLFSIIMLLFSVEPVTRRAPRLATTRPALQH
jgi:hypothetical protein